MTTPKKKRTIEDILNDPEVARRQDTWLRDLRRARDGEPLWDEDAPKSGDKPPKRTLPPRKEQ
jgi:hypothetical protein